MSTRPDRWTLRPLTGTFGAELIGARVQDDTDLSWLAPLLVVLLLLALFSSGVALALAAANVFYHDVNYLWGILSQILFYATPVIYDARSLQFAPLKVILPVRAPAYPASGDAARRRSESAKNEIDFMMMNLLI